MHIPTKGPVCFLLMDIKDWVFWIGEGKNYNQNVKLNRVSKANWTALSLLSFVLLGCKSSFLEACIAWATLSSGIQL